MSKSPQGRGEQDVTRLLDRIRVGEQGAVDQLLSLVYSELRGLAHAVMRDQNQNHTLQPTALVHECFLKLVGNLASFDGRRHFFVVAGRAMRQVISDHARIRDAAKRGGSRRRVTLAGELAGPQSEEIDLVALDESLKRLATLNPRHAQVVELRVFSGFSVEETAEILGLSERSIKSDWAMAKAWLRRELSPGD